MKNQNVFHPNSPHNDTALTLSGHWLTFARATWLLIACVGIVMFAVGVPLHYQQLLIPCAASDCLSFLQLTLDGLPSLTALGMTINEYAAIQLGLFIMVAVVFTGVGFLIFLKRSHEVMALVSSLWLVTLGLTLFEGEVRAVAYTYPWTEPVAFGLVWLGGVVLLVLFFYIFPNGRFVPRWSKWVCIGTIILFIIFGIADQAFPETQLYETIGQTAWGIMILSGIGFQIFRYRRVSTANERLQTKWVIFAMLATFAALLFMIWSLTARQTYNAALQNEAIQNIVEIGFVAFGFLAIPIGIGFSILRYRLYDIDFIIRRTVQYSLVSALLAVVYFGSITVIQGGITAVTTSQSPFAIVLSTLLVAALFNPLRRRVQKFIDRRFYRQKYDAQQVLARFAETARDETDMERLTGELARVVQETMQPEIAGIWIKTNSS